MDKELIEDKLYQLTDQFNERSITSAEFYSMLFYFIQSIFRWNGRTCMILL